LISLRKTQKVVNGDTFLVVFSEKPLCKSC